MAWEVAYFVTIALAMLGAFLLHTFPPTSLIWPIYRFAVLALAPLGIALVIANRKYSAAIVIGILFTGCFWLGVLIPNSNR